MIRRPTPWEEAWSLTRTNIHHRTMCDAVQVVVVVLFGERGESRRRMRNKNRLSLTHDGWRRKKVQNERVWGNKMVLIQHFVVCRATFWLINMRSFDMPYDLCESCPLRPGLAWWWLMASANADSVDSARFAVLYYMWIGQFKKSNNGGQIQLNNAPNSFFITILQP